MQHLQSSKWTRLISPPSPYSPLSFFFYSYFISNRKLLYSLPLIRFLASEDIKQNVWLQHENMSCLEGSTQRHENIIQNCLFWLPTPLELERLVICYCQEGQKEICRECQQLLPSLPWKSYWHETKITMIKVHLTQCSISSNSSFPNLKSLWLIKVDLFRQW